MPFSVKKALIAALALSPLFLSDAYAFYGTSSDGWPVYGPVGPYVLAEVGAGFVTNNKLDGLTPVGSNGTVYASPSQEMSGSFMERFAVGDYLLHPDSITALGFEVGYMNFTTVNSTVNNVINGINTTVSQKATAWSTTLEGVGSFNIIGDSIALLAKFGLGYANIQQYFTSTGAPLYVANSNNNSGIGFAGGLGLRFAFTHHVAFRIEADGLVGTGNAGYAAGLAGFEVVF